MAADVVQAGTPGESLSGVTLRWARLRALAAQHTAPVTLLSEGLSLHARRVLDEFGITTVQQMLTSLDPEELVDRSNVGRTTVAALLMRAEESLPPVTVERSLPDFVEVVDLAIASLPERAKAVVLGRFEAHVKSIQLAQRMGITRERVRQIEEKFAQRIRRAVHRYRLPVDTVLDDDLIEFDELSSGRHATRHPRHFYVALARAVLGGGDSYVDAERYYTSQLEILTREVKSDDAYVLGQFSVERALHMAAELTPALSELPRAAVWERITADLKAAVDSRGYLRGPQPQVGRIIRALLRSAGQPVSVALLVQQLGSVLAFYGEVSYFDQVRLRNKLFAMSDVHMIDEHTAALELPDAEQAKAWVEKAVHEIRQAAKPYSIVRFLDENPEAPFDAWGLASLLKSDPRIAHIGRRLYASAEYDADGPVRIADLIAQALSDSGHPMTRRELLHYVRDRRDCKCGQMEHYFHRVRGLQLYTADIVGLEPLSRSVMLDILARENCVLSLLADREEDGRLQVESLWLLTDEDPDLTRGEEMAIVTASRTWKTAQAEVAGGRLYFGLRED
jgi:hypothetical protein